MVRPGTDPKPSNGEDRGPSRWIGRTETRRLTVVTPTAHLRGQWLQVPRGTPVVVAFDQPVHLVWLGPGHAIDRLPRATRSVAVGKTASGSNAVGSVLVAAAALSWERLSKPVKVTWFPARPYPQALVTPSTIPPAGETVHTLNAAAAATAT